MPCRAISSRLLTERIRRRRRSDNLRLAFGRRVVIHIHCHMSDPLAALHGRLTVLSTTILESISNASYTPPQGSAVSVKSILESLLSQSVQNPNLSENQIDAWIRDFTLACALLSASQSSTNDLLSWIPCNLSMIAGSAFTDLSKAYIGCFGERNAKRIVELGVNNHDMLSEDKRLLIELMPRALPLLKDMIKESSINESNDADELSAASSRVPVGFAIMAAYQFRWLVSQVDYPYLGKLCNLVIPCALTTLDHWSPDVKGQGMISFIHLTKNVNCADLGLFGDVILDACCQNIASDDEIWYHVVDMSVLLVTLIHRGNPRSPWFEKILNEMLSHLERQPRNKERRISCLKLIEPLFNSVGLVLLAHFIRIFPLFFKWMHADDDETVQLVLERTQSVIKLTWIRNSPFIERLVDELVALYKEAAMRRAREEIRMQIVQILILLKKCKGMQFEVVWDRHASDDPNLVNLSCSLNGTCEPRDEVLTDAQAAIEITEA